MGVKGVQFNDIGMRIASDASSAILRKPKPGYISRHYTLPTHYGVGKIFQFVKKCRFEYALIVSDGSANSALIPYAPFKVPGKINPDLASTYKTTADEWEYSCPTQI